MFAAEIDPSDLASAGWGVLLPADCPPEIRQALAPLIDMRAAQAGPLFKILEYRPGESATTFLERHGVRLEVVIPERGVPGYLLIVGEPSGFGFDQQNLLGLYFAVGRLALDSAQDYANYAEATVRAEGRPAPSGRRLTFFIPDESGDPLLHGAAEHFAQPVLEMKTVSLSTLWTADVAAGTSADKAGLIERLGGSATPDLLVTVSSGVTYPPEHPFHRERQGALLCDRPAGEAELSPARYVSAPDIADSADLSGLITVHVGSFSAGTPQLDSLAGLMFQEQFFLASQSSIAPLPRRMLGHSRPLLAFVGQVDRLALCGSPEERWNDLRDFARDLVGRLIRGHRLGYAMNSATMRWAALSSSLAEALGNTQGGLPTDDRVTASLWARKETLRSFVVLGDPAVRFSTS